MKRTVALTSFAMILLSVCVWTSETWARAGGGKSTGSRGSRTSSSPQSPETTSPSRQAVPPSAVQQPMPQRSGWMSGLTGGIMGFALGGLLGGMLFGGLGSGLFGGVACWRSCSLADCCILPSPTCGGASNRPLPVPMAMLHPRGQRRRPGNPSRYLVPRHLWQRQRVIWSVASGISGRWIAPLTRCTSRLLPPMSSSRCRRRGRDAIWSPSATA